MQIQTLYLLKGKMLLLLLPGTTTKTISDYLQVVDRLSKESGQTL